MTLSINADRSSRGSALKVLASEVILKAINSTMITAPSMMIPKSMAPKLIKLASTPKIFIRINAKNKHNGMTDATTSPERRFPSSNTTTKMTIKHPKMRFSLIVKLVFAINSLRSRKALMRTPLGSELCISSTRFFTASITFLESAPLSIITCPSTFSPSPFPVIAPKRFAEPKPTFAISFT